jgi:hypothetical protein
MATDAATAAAAGAASADPVAIGLLSQRRLV